MDLTFWSFIVASIALFFAIACLFMLNKMRKEQLAPKADNFSTKGLELQAYERLVLLTERIGLPQLISRVSQPGLSAFQMQQILVENIRQEFEYNTSQQIYVSKASWELVKQLKERNILLINQVASTLSADASGNELSRNILEYALQSDKGYLHEIVNEAISEEAKKIFN